MVYSDEQLVARIMAMKKERNAVILVHNYQLGEVQDIGDFVGDSLELSQKAAATSAETIVFCGVSFMAETAAILCPGRTVLLPEQHSECPMAAMITAPQLRQEKQKHPNARVVCYINSTAAVKALSDVCCTSANAARVVSSFDKSTEIMFVPDQYLGSYVAKVTGRDLILWPGYCPTHARIQPQDILRQKTLHPQAKVMVHPECRPEVSALADAVLSTGGMTRYARETDAKEIIVGTEVGIIYRLKKENPDKSFIPATEQAVCPRMKLITLHSVLWSLENMKYRVTVPERTRTAAKAALDRMLAIP